MKKQIKKGLSLMLAVLMVLSCWVWVAPTEAEAADAAGGEYYIEVTYANELGDCSKTFDSSQLDRDDGDSTCGVAIYYKAVNGTGAESIYCFDLQNQKTTNGTVSAKISGFPTKIRPVADGGGVFGATGKLRVYTVKVGPDANNMTTIWNGEMYLDTSSNYKDIVLNYDGSYETYDGGAKTNENQDNAKINSTSGAWDLPYPVIEGMSGVTNIEIPRMGDTSVVTTSTITGKVVDQYGVAWHEDPTYLIGQTPDATVGIEDENGSIWLTQDGDGVKVSLNHLLQQDFPVTDDPSTSVVETERDFYLIANYHSKAANATATPAYRTLKIKYPTYKWSFQSDYVVGGVPASYIGLSDGSKNSDGSYERSYAYNQTFNPYPTGEASRDGYYFLGFWTNPQPSTTNANPWVQENVFMRPVSSTAYAALDEDAKKLAYDAGTQYVAPSSAPATIEDVTYYAWWLSEDITVKFYDIDGSFIDSFDVKYGDDDDKFDWPTPTETTYTNGALSYSNWNGRWVNIDGEVIDSTGYTFTHDLILSPKYETINADYQYAVRFYKIYGAVSNNYAYRDTAVALSETEVGTYQQDEAYTYSFEGWTTSPSQVEGTRGSAVVMIEDGNFDANGNAVHLVEDFTVRSDATYYPVFRRHLRSYDVSFQYRNNTGNDVTETVSYKYGQQITPPATIPAKVAYGGAEYTVLGWNKGNTQLDNFYNEFCSGAATYIARYDAGVPTAYDVIFSYYDEDGNAVTTEAEVNHGDKILQETVDLLNPAQYYDDGESRLEFLGVWEYEGVEYTAEQLLEFSPVNHVTFTAKYGNAKPFYTVTYTDGEKTQEYRVVEGTKLPVWNVDVKDEEDNVTTEEYIPERAETLEGKYEFIGWFDAEEGGTQYYTVDDGDKATAINGNVTLYPQFSFKLHEYTVTFKNWKGETVLEEKVNYGASLGSLEAAAKALVENRPADETYTYTYLGWDKKVPATCQGANLEFVAQYKNVYIYYDIEWYGGAEFDEDGNLVNYVNYNEAGVKDVAAAPLTTTHYTYGDKLRTPSVTLNMPASTIGEDGKTVEYVLEGWYYLDANGVEQKFARGVELTDALLAGDDSVEVYAKYKAAAKKYTVTVITTVDDPSTEADEQVKYEVVVEENGLLDISNPASGFHSATEHKAFSKWTTVNADDETVDFDITTPITADITITANYVYSAHEYTLSEVTKAPTYPEDAYYDYVEGNPSGKLVEASTGAGSKDEWCECSKEGTLRTAEIPALMDEILPTGTTYVGTTRWDSYDEAAAATELTYANKNTDLIITTADKGGAITCQCDPDSDELCFNCAHKAEFNPTGKGSGVKYIYTYTAQADAQVNVADEYIWKNAIYDWNTIKGELIGYYKGWDNVPLMYQEYNANVTGKAGNLNLTEGETYITYFKMIDKLGNVSYMRTGEYMYDNTAPKLTITGDSNAKKNKFCVSATIAVTEANPVTITVNGEAQTLTDGKLTLTEADLYQIVATDAAGNKTTASIEVVADHETRVNETPATCTTPGYRSEICNICNKVIGTAGTTEALDHDYTETTVEATCLKDGYVLVTCSRCDYEERKTDADGNVIVYPKTGHTYPTDDNGEFVYTTVKAATCVDDGKAVCVCTNANCDKDGTHILEKILPVDANAHSFRNPVTIKPNCTDGGYTTKACRLCGAVEKYDEVPAKGHTQAKDKDGNILYNIITKATCAAEGSKTAYCAVCKLPIGDPIAIDRTNDHKWVIDESETKYPTTEEAGEIWYKCSKEGCDATYGPVAVDKIEEYTVKFIGTVLETVTDEETGKTSVVEKAYEKSFTLTEGETIDADDLAEQAKLDKVTEDEALEYTFAGWFDAEEGGTKYALPMNVSKDLTLYAQFTSSDIVYKVKFQVPTTYSAETGFGGYKEVKTLMGAIGTVRTPAETPAFAETAVNSFAFEGWEKAGVVYDKVTVEGDFTYRASFKVTQKTYDVIFMNGTEALGKVTVPAGGTAVYEGETPTKAYDDANHYTFKGWDKALTNITAKTTVYAEYTATAHTVDYDNGTEKQKVSCSQIGITEYGCTACDYTEQETTAKLAHTPVTEFDEETGKNITSCDVCGEVLSSVDASYTIKFENWNGNRLGTETVKVNGEVKYTGVTPTRPSTEEHSYTFKGWVVAGDEDDAEATVYASDKLPNATANVTYVAVFTETDRVYTVRFATSDNVVVKTISNVKYGASVTFTYADFVAAATALGLDKDDYVPASDSKGHWSFAEWDTEIGSIEADTYVRPVFAQTEHVYTDSVTGATCEEPGGVKHSCDCGYYYIDGNVPAKGHNWVVSQVIAPDYATETNGKRIYTCLNGCGETKTEEISGKLTEIKVTVKDSDGNPVNNALVRLYAKGANGEYADTGLNDRTKTDGIVIFYVQPGEYRVYVSAEGMTETWYDVVVDEDGTTTGNQGEVVVQKPAVDTSCSCSCHKNNFWGTIFRFFQKIIKLFIGEASCCSDPDSRI